MDTAERGGAWPYLTGFDVIVGDWYKYGSPPYGVWVRKNIRALYVKAQSALATGGAAWACDQTGTYVYDGAQHGGITFPTVRAAVNFPASIVQSPIVRAR